MDAVPKVFARSNFGRNGAEREKGELGAGALRLTFARRNHTI